MFGFWVGQACDGRIDPGGITETAERPVECYVEYQQYRHCKFFITLVVTDLFVDFLHLVLRRTVTHAFS